MVGAGGRTLRRPWLNTELGKQVCYESIQYRVARIDSRCIADTTQAQQSHEVPSRNKCYSASVLMRIGPLGTEAAEQHHCFGWISRMPPALPRRCRLRPRHNFEWTWWPRWVSVPGHPQRVPGGVPAGGQRRCSDGPGRGDSLWPTRTVTRTGRTSGPGPEP